MGDFTLEAASLEREAVRLGEERERAAHERARSTGTQSTTRPGRALLRRHVLPLALALRAWLRDSRRLPEYLGGGGRSLLVSLPPRVAALIALKTTVDEISTTRTVASLSARIGGRLADERQLRDLRKADTELAERVRRATARFSGGMRARIARRAARERQHTFSEWTRAERAQAGLTMLALIERHTRLVDLRMRRRGRRTVKFVVPTEECVLWWQRAEDDAATPYYMPTADEPADWTGPRTGGYGAGVLPKVNLVRPRAGSRWRTPWCKPLAESVSWAQSARWRVNDAVAEVLRHVVREEPGFAGMPEPGKEAKPRRPKTTDRAALGAWRAACRDIERRNFVAAGRRQVFARCDAMAARLRGREALYFPHTCDYRGRAYPLVSLMTPQGPDVGRALLEFARPEEVRLDDQWDTPAAWHLTRGGRHFGVKGSLNQLLSWAHENVELVMAVAQDPLECRWWAQADKPWMFLAWCLEAAELLSEGRVLSRLPVSVDGTNNGLQIYALLLGDVETARITNCLRADWDTQPEDAYGEVAQTCTDSVRRASAEGDMTAVLWTDFLGPDGLPRSAAKRPVMTLPYGVTPRGAEGYLRAWHEEEFDRTANDCMNRAPGGTRKAVAWLWERLAAAISERLSAAVMGRDWFQSLAFSLAKAGRPVEWTSPIGMRVMQDYRLRETRRIRTEVAGCIHPRASIQLLEDGDELSRRRQALALPPNFVHSMDAGCLHRLVLAMKARGVRDLALVHDGFGAHATQVPLMVRELRGVYAEVFQTDWMAQLCERAPSDVALRRPERGPLDSRAVLDAALMFS